LSSSITGAKARSPRYLALVARHQADAVGLERIECVFDLAQAALDIGQGQDREQPEAARMVGHQARPILVAFARERAARRVVAEPDARLADRRDRGRDPSPIHVLDRALRRPVGERALPGVAAEHDLGDPARRRQMMMNIDPARPGGLRVRRRQAERKASRDSLGHEPAATPARGRRRGATCASSSKSRRRRHGRSPEKAFVGED